jgi:hypothetical protein
VDSDSRRYRGSAGNDETRYSAAMRTLGAAERTSASMFVFDEVLLEHAYSLRAVSSEAALPAAGLQ